MRNPFKKRRKAPEFTGNCLVRQHTGDGAYVGHCYYSTYDGVCPHHGDVALHLLGEYRYGSVYQWPRDFELPQYDGNPWAEGLRRERGECPRGTPGCKYADCSNAWGKSCSGPDAPRHVDMGN